MVAINNAMAVVNTQATQRTLSSIVMESEGNALIVKAFGGYSSSKTSVPAEGELPIVAIDGPTLKSMFSPLSGEKIKLDVDNDSLLATCGRTKLEVPIYGETPVIPENTEPELFVVSNAVVGRIAHALGFVRPAIKAMADLVAMTGFMLHCEDGVLDVVGASYRIVGYERILCDPQAVQDIDAILPLDSLKILSMVNTARASIAITESSIIIKEPGVEFRLQRLEGQPVNYTPYLLDDGIGIIKVSSKAIIESLASISSVAKMSQTVNIATGADFVEISSSSQGSKAMAEATVEVENFESISVPYTPLYEFVSKMSGETLTILITANRRAIKVIDGYKACVLFAKIGE